MDWEYIKSQINDYIDSRKEIWRQLNEPLNIQKANVDPLHPNSYDGQTIQNGLQKAAEVYIAPYKIIYEKLSKKGTPIDNKVSPSPNGSDNNNKSKSNNTRDYNTANPRHINYFDYFNNVGVFKFCRYHRLMLYYSLLVGWGYVYLTKLLVIILLFIGICLLLYYFIYKV